MKSKITIVAILSFLATSAMADNNSIKDFKSTANINNSCLLSVNDVDFGDITPDGKEDVGWTSTTKTIGNISMLCTSGANYSIALNIGSNPYNNNRRLKNLSSNQFIDYTFCQTNAVNVTAVSCVKTWKSGSTAYVGKGSGISENIPMYGFIKKGYYAPGIYTDTMSITISF